MNKTKKKKIKVADETPREGKEKNPDKATSSATFGKVWGTLEVGGCTGGERNPVAPKRAVKKKMEGLVKDTEIWRWTDKDQPKGNRNRIR